MELLTSLRASVAEALSVKKNSINIRIFENSSGVFYTLEEFLNHYNPEELAKGQCNLIIKIDCEGKVIGTFQLKDMYNCCGIIVGSDLFINDGMRSRGLGTLFTKFMIDFSKYYGYGILQAADVTKNEYQIKIFNKLKWIPVIEFKNPKTGNDLTMWVYKF
jgi:hypothetical protein